MLHFEIRGNVAQFLRTPRDTRQGTASATLRGTIAVSQDALSHTDVTTVSNPMPPPPVVAKLDQHRPQGLGAHPSLPSPISIIALSKYLSDYHSALSDYLIQGFSFGFSLDFQGPQLSNRCTNLPSALQSPDIVSTKLQRELDAGRIQGPFRHPPFSTPFNVSPIGLHPKKAPGEFRLIHHLSHPHSASVNSFIPPQLSTVHYATIGDAISSILKHGQGCFMAKSDIRSAFRLIPIHPRDYPLLGFMWSGEFYFDRCLPMGAASSCAIFERFSTALEWITLGSVHNCSVHHVLDDFIFIAPTAMECQMGLDAFLEICKNVGVPIADEKTQGPCTTLTFLGIELDSLDMESRLPIDKLEKCQSSIRDAIGRRSATLRELQSITGLLNFACSVVQPGRAFLRRLIQLTMGKTRPSHFINLTKGSKDDLRMWLSFLAQFNGKSVFLSEVWLSSVKLKLYTDAAQSLGYGAIFRRSWFYGEWPTEWKKYSISVLELYPIVLAVETWANTMANQCVLLYTDNEAIVSVINKQTARDPILMILVRRLVLTSLRFNILFQAIHIPGVTNTLPDLLSRLQVEKFRKLAKDMDHQPTIIPCISQGLR